MHFRSGFFSGRTKIITELGSGQVVSMHAHPLCRRQVIDSPPAHLQQAESDDDELQRRADGAGAVQPIMNIDKI